MFLNIYVHIYTHISLNIYVYEIHILLYIHISQYISILYIMCVYVYIYITSKALSPTFAYPLLTSRSTSHRNSFQLSYLFIFTSYPQISE